MASEGQPAPSYSPDQVQSMLERASELNSSNAVSSAAHSQSVRRERRECHDVSVQYFSPDNMRTKSAGPILCHSINSNKKQTVERTVESSELSRPRQEESGDIEAALRAQFGQQQQQQRRDRDLLRARPPFNDPPPRPDGINRQVNFHRRGSRSRAGGGEVSPSEFGDSSSRARRDSGGAEASSQASRRGNNEVNNLPHDQQENVPLLGQNDQNDLPGPYACNFRVLCCLLYVFVASALLLTGFIIGLVLIYINQKWNTVPIFISSAASYQVYSGIQTVLMTMVCMKTNTTDNLDWILYTASCDKISRQYIRQRTYSINGTATSEEADGYYFYLIDGSFIQPHPQGIAKYCSTPSIKQASKLQEVCDAERKCKGEKLKEVIGKDPFEDANQHNFYYICVTRSHESPHPFHLNVTELYYYIPNHERNECENIIHEEGERLKCCNIKQQSAYAPGQNCVYIGNNNDPSANPITTPFEIELRITYDSVMRTVLVTLLMLTFILLFVVVVLLLYSIRKRR